MLTIICIIITAWLMTALVVCLALGAAASRRRPFQPAAAERLAERQAGACVHLIPLALALSVPGAAGAIPQLRLAWDPNPEPDIAGYRIHYGTVSCCYTNSVDVGKVTNTCVVNLPDRRAWFFAVTAYNTGQLESDFSNEAAFVSVGEALAAWQEQYFSATNLADPGLEATLWGDLADPDHDGQSNLAEYALGLNPTHGGDGEDGIQVSIRDGYLYFSYRHRKNDASLVYMPQVSSDRLNWADGPAVIERLAPTEINAVFEWVNCRDLTPLTADQPRHLRLRLTRDTGYYLSAASASTVETLSATYIGALRLLPGNGGAGQKRTVFSLPVVRAAVYAGTVSALGAGTMVDSQAGWVDDQFNGPNGACFVEFSSGQRVDIIDTVAGSRTLVLARDVSALVPPGAGYHIRPHQTLASVFGAHNESGLLAGQNLQAADNVVLYEPVSQVAQSFFYVNLAGYEGWYDINYQRRDQQILRPELGVMVYRKSNAPATCAVTGVIKEGPTVVPVHPNFNLVGTLQTTRAMKLSELNLYTGDTTTGMAAGRNLQEADTVSLFKADGTTAAYFYLVYNGVAYGWMDTGYQSADNISLAAGDAFFIYRNPQRGAFNWTVPAEVAAATAAEAVALPAIPARRIIGRTIATK